MLLYITTAFNGVLDTPIGQDATVVVGQGLIGMLVTQLVRRSAAAQVIVDRIAGRRAMSEKLGADLVLDPERSTLPWRYASGRATVAPTS